MRRSACCCSSRSSSPCSSTPDRAAGVRARASNDPTDAARRSPPPPAARVHDGRAQPALQTVRAARTDPPLIDTMNPLAEDRRPPLTPQLALRVAVAGEPRAGAVRDHVLPPVVPAGAVGRPVPGPGEGQPGPHDRRPGAARRDRRPQRQRARGLQVRDRRGLVARGSARAVAADAARPPAAPRLRPLQPPGSRARDVDQASQVPDRRLRCHAAIADRLCGRAGLRAASLPGRDDQDRRPQGRSVLPRRAPAAVPRASASSRFGCAAIRWGRSPRSCSGRCGRITPQEVHEARYRGVSQNSIVGQSGLEWYYDHYLRGQDGAERVQVDALGHFTGDLATRKPIQGHSLKLSLDVSLQRAGQHALQKAINTNPPAQAGRIRGDEPRQRRGLRDGLAADVQPQHLHQAGVGRDLQAAQQRLEQLPTDQPRDYERLPTGSTFKPITATAALESGAWNAGTVYDDTGQYCIDTQCPPQRGQRLLRRAQPDRGDQGLLRRVLLQPRAP